MYVLQRFGAKRLLAAAQEKGGRSSNGAGRSGWRVSELDESKTAC